MIQFVVVLEKDPMKAKKQLRPYFGHEVETIIIDRFPNHYRARQLMLFHYFTVPESFTSKQCINEAKRLSQTIH